jgi:hypothetical protein
MWDIFFVKDRIDKGEIKIEHCPTDDMIADFFTKPLQGQKFIKFRNKIMGADWTWHQMVQQECVGRWIKNIKLQPTITQYVH